VDTNEKQFGLNDYALEVVHYKARKLVGTAGFREDDVEDIKQDLIVDLLERLPKLDPAVAKYETFVTRVVERKLCNMIRDRTTEVRDFRREQCSLNEDIDVGEDEPRQRVVTISQDDVDLRTGKHSRPEEERRDLQLDLAEAIASLPVELRKAAEMLMAMPITDVARELGVPRSTFYDNHLARIRQAFEAHGLGDYVLS